MEYATRTDKIAPPIRTIHTVGPGSVGCTAPQMPIAVRPPIPTSTAMVRVATPERAGNGTRAATSSSMVKAAAAATTRSPPSC